MLRHNRNDSMIPWRTVERSHVRTDTRTVPRSQCPFPAEPLSAYIGHAAQLLVACDTFYVPQQPREGRRRVVLYFGSNMRYRHWPEAISTIQLSRWWAVHPSRNLFARDHASASRRSSGAVCIFDRSTRLRLARGPVEGRREGGVGWVAGVAARGRAHRPSRPCPRPPPAAPSRTPTGCCESQSAAESTRSVGGGRRGASAGGLG
jgi:hypothetical protein